MQKSEIHVDDLVDLENCRKMRLLSLSKLSIQPRTSPSKFATSRDVPLLHRSYPSTLTSSVGLGGYGGYGGLTTSYGGYGGFGGHRCLVFP